MPPSRLKLKAVKNKRAKVSFILTISGLLLLTVSIPLRLYQLRVLSFTKAYPTLTSGRAEGSSPAFIKIDKVGLDLPVTEASIKDGIWEIWYGGASHLDVSANPGAGGNIVIYGHNKNLLFGPIRWLDVGDTIELTDNEGKEYLYEVFETATVSPDEIDYVLPKEDEVLTLYTCTGFLDSKRYIVIAKPRQD